MLKKPEIFDSVEVVEFGDFTPFKVGGHKCIIKNAEEYTSPISGNSSLKICLDADKGDEQEGYFQKQFDENQNADKKWSNGATKYVSLRDEENCVRMLKGFITAVENSNPNYKYDWNKEVSQLVGKKVGATFGLEEYQDSEGEVRVATKVRDIRSLNKIADVKIPRVKLLDGSYVDYENYKKLEDKKPATTLTRPNVEIKEEDLPFDL